MKFEYEKPDLEELELILEGSFADDTTGSGIDKDDKDPSSGDNWD